VGGPLNGTKIIELAGIGPGPFACMMLADMGANVLRLERGDVDAKPEPTGDVLARSRRSVAIDLKSQAGKDLVLELCQQADVLIEGFRPGVTERLGLGPDDVEQRNPRLVYGRMTGYGQEGPLSMRAGHDINYIAVSGALWPIGRVGEAPVPPLNLVGDFGGGGLFLALGVVAALLSARSTGRGQVVDAAMVDGSATLMAMTHSFLNRDRWIEQRGSNLLDSGAHFYDVYETKDSKFMAVGAIESKFYDELLQGLDLSHEQLPDQNDVASWPIMKLRFAEVFHTKTRDEWTSIFSDVDACVTPVLSPREAALHPYNVERNVFDIDGPIQPLPAPRFSRTPSAIRSAGLTAGSGTREGLEDWGIDDTRQRALRLAGAFGSSTVSPD
jgi:alpha-methylacyl-CoA racemase